MYKHTQAIYDALIGTGKIKCKKVELGSTSAVLVPFETFNIIFANSDDDTDTSVRVVKLASKVGMFKRGKMLEKLNALNDKYRYVKFVLDKDGDVNLEYDLPLSGVNPASCALELVLRISKIVEEVMPELKSV